MRLANPHRVALPGISWNSQAISGFQSAEGSPSKICMRRVQYGRLSLRLPMYYSTRGHYQLTKRQKKRNIPLVSVLWIEESKRLMKKACEKTFCALHLDRYEEPDIFSSVTTKIKRPRHLRTLSHCRKGHQRKKQKTSNVDKENDSYETYFNPEMFNENAALVKDGIISTLEHVTGKTFSEKEEDDQIPCSQFTAEINEPLTKKLYNRFLMEIKEEESNTQEKSTLRHSCPPKLKIESEEQNKKLNTEVITNGNVENLPINGTKMHCCRKTLQLPITFYFQTATITKRLPSIVFTGLHFDEVEMLTNVVHNIRDFQVEKVVSNRCTHVVCGYPPKRTLNLLRGIARGCWILSKEWVIKSLEFGKWLNEEEFELNYFLPAIQKARSSQQKNHPYYQNSLFSSCGPFYLGRGCSPPASDLEELISLCGGHLVSCARAARIVVVGQGRTSPISISQRLSKPPQFVTEKWVLDSISEDSPCSFAHPYIVQVGACRKSVT